jgi:hypothetical protein
MRIAYSKFTMGRIHALNVPFGTLLQLPALCYHRRMYQRWGRRGQ